MVLQVRKAQVSIGDREVYVNEEGERMSRLKEVNSDWIIRRLERWGQRVWLQRCLPQHGHIHMASALFAAAWPHPYGFSAVCRSMATSIWLQRCLPQHGHIHMASALFAAAWPHPYGFSAVCRSMATSIWLQRCLPQHGHIHMASALFAAAWPHPYGFSATCRSMATSI